MLTSGPVPTLGGSLAMIGLIPGPAPQAPPNASTQMQNDLKQLGKDSLAIQTKSGVTVAELTALGGVDKSIADAKITLDGKALMTAQTELTNAVVAGTSLTQAKGDFAKLFGGKLSSDAVTKLFNLEVQIVKDSHASAAQLSAIAKDEAQLQKDLPSNGTPPPAPPAPPTPSAQVQKDLQKLQADTLAVQTKSSVTVAEMTALQGADRQIANAGIRLDGKALMTAQSEMATAIATGGSTAQAHSDFVKLFGGKLSASAIDQIFGLEMQIVKDSHVTSAQLNAIATDRAQLQKDLGSGSSGSNTPAPPPPSLGGSLGMIGVIPSAQAPPPPPNGGSGNKNS